MNAQTDDPNKTKLAPTDAPQLPAIKQPIKKWKAFRELIKNADCVVGWYDELGDYEKEFRQHREPGDDESIPELYEVEIGEEMREVIAECVSSWQLLDAKTNYDDEGDLKREIIQKRLALMLGAFPAKAGTTEGYPKQLLEHVAIVEGLKYLMLEGACRELETGAKFQPAIAEVIEAINKQKELWRARMFAINDIERKSRELLPRVAALKLRIEAEQAAKAAREATAHRARMESRVKDETTRLEQARKALQDAQTAVYQHTDRLALAEMMLEQAIAAEAEAKQAAQAKPQP